MRRILGLNGEVGQRINRFALAQQTMDGLARVPLQQKGPRLATDYARDEEFDRRLEPDRECFRCDLCPRRRIGERAPSRCHNVRGLAQQSRDDFAFSSPEGRFAESLENLRNRASGRCFNFYV